jgi:hypothetical protein
MDGRVSQLGFEFSQHAVPSVASVELAATRARAGSLARTRKDGSTDLPTQLDTHILEGAPEAPNTASDAELAHALELALRARHGDRPTGLQLRVTDNVRTMVSLRRDKARDQLEVRVHHMFLQAGPEVWSALGEYVFSGEREAARSIARYIEQHRKSIRRPERRALSLSAAGRHHDLSEICQAVNQRYFEGQVSVNVTWARKHAARANPGRRSIKLGSYTSRDRLIRVHPALDAAFVPRYFIEYIVYHEMLHHVLPPKLQNGRRELHGPAFLARERQFQDYQAALDWERQNLAKLLRRRVRRKPSAPEQ